MTRCITRLLLALGLFGLLGASLYAADEWEIPNPTQTDGTQTEAVTPPPASTGVTTQSAPAKRVNPSKKSIEKLVEQGKVNEAETDYLQWAGLWRKDDPALLQSIESKLLRTQADAGNTEAFLTLLKSGDSAALNQLREKLRTGNTDLTSEQLGIAVRALIANSSSADYPLFSRMLKSQDATMVNLAIEALGNRGFFNASMDLHSLLASADLQRSLLIARAIGQMGGAPKLNLRYLQQLDMPLVDVPERAALMLAVNGNSRGLPLIKQVLDAKNPMYYPLALSALGKLPQSEVKGYVLAGLAGNEQEQLAAIKSINVLPLDQVETTLVNLAFNEKTPMSVRVAAVNQLAVQRGDNVSVKLRSILALNSNGNVPVKAAAIEGLANGGFLADNAVRGTVRMQLFEEDATILLAARGALLGYATKAR